MRDSESLLKSYGRNVALFNDVITKREAITTTFCHQHNICKHDYVIGT
jgi:hypothetical protein